MTWATRPGSSTVDACQLTTEIQQILHLLSSMDELTGVTLHCQSSNRPVTVTVRKTVQGAAGRRTWHRFWWAASAAGLDAGEWVGGQPYATAEAAYETAVWMIQAGVSERIAQDGPAASS